MRPIGPIKELIIHHTASWPDMTAAEIIRMHVEDNGWDDAGYHYFINEAGKLHYLRPVASQGAHAPPNRGRLGLAIAGDNTVEMRRWYPVQIRSAQRVIDAFEMLYPGLAVLGHREVADTLCPGLDLPDVFVLSG